VKGPRRADLR